MPTDVFLGIDIGTTNIKVVAIEAGNLLALATQPTPEQIDADGNHYFDGEELWRVCAGLLRKVSEQIPPGRSIAGISTASMGEAGVLIDSSGTPIFPVMPWYDQRPAHWVDWWREKVSPEEIFKITGLTIDHTFTANKLLWLRELFPHEFALGTRWLCLGDWISFRLCGEQAMNLSLASRTMMLDLKNRQWSGDLLDIAGFDPALLPELAPSGQVIGRVNRQAALETGLPEGVPVVAGGHDHLCAAVAAGAVTPTVMLDSTGTAEALLLTLGQPKMDPAIMRAGLSCGCHTVPNRYYVMGGFLVGGVLDWAAQILGYSEPGAIPSLLLAQDAATVPPGANGVVFIPYLEGGTPPENDSRAWGAWMGLRRTHTRAMLARAVLEGVSFSIRQLYDYMIGTCETTPEELRCVGGGTRNTEWQKLKASILGRPIMVLKQTNAAAQGAALIASMGAGGSWGEFKTEPASSPVEAIYRPDPRLQAVYEQLYRERFIPLAGVYKTCPELV